MSSEQNAVFIDASFLLTVGSSRVTGTSLRSATSVDTETLIKGVIDTTEKDSGLDTLRVYWYDASRDGVFHDTHKRIALLDDVKVRLGRIGFNGNQKGVDLRMGLDLVEVARNRVAKVAYLLTGDDDFAEAVEAAQDLGMKVVLVGLEKKDHYLGVTSVAEHLALQVDRIITLPDELITRCFVPKTRPKFISAQSATTVISPPADSSVPASSVPTPSQVAQTPGPKSPTSDHDKPAVPTPMSVRENAERAAHRETVETPAAPVKQAPVYTSSLASLATTQRLLDAAEAVGNSVAESWFATCTQSELEEVLSDRPNLPIDIDATLLRDCASKIGEYDTDRQSVRRHLRQTFWEKIDFLS